jgi:hypothetical protein
MGWMPTSRTTHSFKLGIHPPNTLHYQDRGYARSCNPTSENSTSTHPGNKTSGILGFLLWHMADRFDVVALKIEDEGSIVARMVLGAKPRNAVVAPTRRHGRLMEGINGCALIGSKRDVEGLSWLTLADPEVRLAPPPEPRCRDAGFYDQLVAKRGEDFRVEALALLEIRDGNTYVIQHCSRLPRLQDRTDIRQAEYPRNALLHNGELSRTLVF